MVVGGPRIERQCGRRPQAGQPERRLPGKGL